ncbi:hypothetical protein PENANT_c031G07330 [Penicillium antarcticum]|uniref:Uncharacterized protein n=1 Tax=Penicillium antarcticum TaxID=416450 RepID=A0A1V6PV92_9EURO|nr:hypothetical protein PENANT_c031G07330 [Penicillium antarcticum]
MTSPAQTILFLTNPEHGQSNVILAVAQEFLRRGEHEVHIASFKPLAARVQAITDQADHDQLAHFHTIAGASMSELVARSTPDICHKPGLAGSIDGCKKINVSVLAWTPEEYLQSYRSCLEILKAVQPAVVVVDPLLHLGLDAARSLQMKIVILWPVPLKDVVIMIQPKLGILWKYPLCATSLLNNPKESS